MTSEIPTPPERPPYVLAAIISAAVFALYAITIAPTTQFWDTSEYIAAAKVLGIPHPPGNPLFVLLANVWGQLPLVEHYALRINLLAAVTSALSSGLLFLVAERFLRELMPGARVQRYAAAIAGIIVGATAFTVWNQSVVNEKVYTLSLLSISLILWLGTRWIDRSRGPGRDQILLIILYLLALTSTNHTMGLLSAPAIMVLVLQTLRFERAQSGEWAKWLVFCTIATMFVFLPGVLQKGWEQPIVFVLAGLVLAAPLAFAVRTGHSRFAAFALLVTVVGLSVYVLLPIRAALFPPINEGEPTTWETLRAVLNREQYQKGPLVPRQADILWQYANYIQYFSWQFGRDWDASVRNGLAYLFAGLGLLGGVWHWRKDRRGAAALTALMLTVTVLLVFYLDFKYGYSIRPGENLLREVRERDYFFVASFQLWGVWVALGFGAVLHWGAGFFGERLAGNAKWVPAAPALLLCLVPLIGNRLSASRAGETLPRDVAVDILQSVEPYGILITAGDNDTFPLWYAQEVEGIRTDVTVANLSLMNTRWHNRQIKRRAIAPFDSANAVPPYRGRSWPRPTEPVLSWSYDELDSLDPFVRIEAGRVIQLGTVVATPQSQILERADIITLRLIQDNLGKRPIYLSRTTGNYGERMGLAPYLVGHGLARKLMPEPVEESDNIVQVAGLGWMDVERTKTLLFDVYHAESAARERPFGWPDKPSESILALYAIVYASFGEFLSTRLADTGNVAADSVTAQLVLKANDWAERILRNTSFR